MLMADGTEPPCPTCGHSFNPGDFKVERPLRFDPAMRRQQASNSHTGAKPKGWVHERCAPDKSYQHGRKRR